MCGIFGIITKQGANTNKEFVKKGLHTIAKLSMARGKDSSGMVFKNNNQNNFELIKGDIPVPQLLKSTEYLSILNRALHNYQNNISFQAIGHARLVTNGSQLNDVNNQPVVKDGIIGIHNGIIVNDNQLWEQNPDLKKQYEIDTEVLLSLIRKEINNNHTLPNAIINTLNKIEGTVSSALLFEDRNELALFTNNGSLYYLISDDLLMFASEKYFLDEVQKKLKTTYPVYHINAFNGIIFNTTTFLITPFNQHQKFEHNYTSLSYKNYEVKITNLKGNFDTEIVIDPVEFVDRSKESNLISLLENNLNSINTLKRCSKCILPETFPFITFDEKGECNYCKNHTPKKQNHTLTELKQLVKKYKRSDGLPDCIVPFSGGRDSTYALHIVKKELGLNPIAYTYDWGMVTDLARRNIARACGKLGVENIIVSADIKWKRDNIKKNIEAWLKHPNLGMVPLFMAGDKYFFHYCNVVKKQTGIDLNIWGINNLENTNFKTGFAGLPPQFNKKRIYSLSIKNQLKLFGFVGKNVLKSPAYINQSVIDSLGSFAVRYLSPKKDYFHLFDYYKWDEQELETLIKNEYHWEKAIDTDSTWRIGDGTASFYNYIYYTVTGFTENDTFRSNQIREGLITREEALKKVNKENEVRYETMRWYLKIVGIDFKTAITTINNIPKLYKTIR